MNPAPAMHGEYYGHGEKYQPVDSNPGSYVQMQQMRGDSMQKPSELSSDGAPAVELPGGDLNHEINFVTVARNTAGRNERGFRRIGLLPPGLGCWKDEDDRIAPRKRSH